MALCMQNAAVEVRVWHAADVSFGACHECNMPGAGHSPQRAGTSQPLRPTGWHACHSAQRCCMQHPPSPTCVRSWDNSSRPTPRAVVVSRWSCVHEDFAASHSELAPYLGHHGAQASPVPVRHPCMDHTGVMTATGSLVAVLQAASGCCESLDKPSHAPGVRQKAALVVRVVVAPRSCQPGLGSPPAAAASATVHGAGRRQHTAAVP